MIACEGLVKEKACSMWSATGSCFVLLLKCMVYSCIFVTQIMSWVYHKQATIAKTVEHGKKVQIEVLHICGKVLPDDPYSCTTIAGLQPVSLSDSGA